MKELEVEDLSPNVIYCLNLQLLYTWTDTEGVYQRYRFTVFEIHQHLSFIQPCVCIVLLCYKNQKTFKTLFIHASNPWWWFMKGLKVLRTILVNSSTNSNLKLRHLSGNLKGS